MPGHQQQELFSPQAVGCSLPTAYDPVAPEGLNPRRIVLCKGSIDTPEREAFVRRICAVYPHVPVEERLGLPHTRVELDGGDPLALHAHGKRTLVFGELRNAVRFSEESGNTCPNYWHFSLYGYCPYGCSYCYLAGTQGVWFSPTVKIYVNLPEILSRIDRVTNDLARPTSFYHGKLQDGLALDPLTAYSTGVVPFFARHPHARQVLLTKSASVRRLLPLEHRGHTTLSWSLNPPEVARRFETNVPSVEQRIAAMAQCARAGYPVRAVVMPIIPVPGWAERYRTFLEELLAHVPLERLTLGGICSYPNALRLMTERLGRDNAISNHLPGTVAKGDGRARYDAALRARLYDTLFEAARSVRPDLALSLCLEETAVLGPPQRTVGSGPLQLRVIGARPERPIFPEMHNSRH